MATSSVRRLLALLLIPSPLACSDVVVGQYSGTSTSAGATDSGLSTADATDAEPALASCFADDFADGLLDPMLWNTWTEADSSIAESGDRLRFTPPSFGLFDAGVVSRFDSRFDLDGGWVRMHVAEPPAVDQPVALFVIVSSGPQALTLSLGGGSVDANASVDEVPVAGESFPKQPYPQWIGIRGDGPVAHFEFSDDGQAWTTLSTLDLPGSFEDSAVLIMAQTYGPDAAQQEVSVHEVEVCTP